MQIAQNIGIAEGTLYEWKKRFPELDESIKKGKAPVDYQVENALLKRALGYDYEEVVTEIYDDVDGKSRKHVRRIKKHMPSDPASAIFWLKNRRPDKWRDKSIELPQGDNRAIAEFVEAAKGLVHGKV